VDVIPLPLDAPGLADGPWGLSAEVCAAERGKLLRKWKLGLAGPASWGSMFGSYAQFLEGMDGMKQSRTALDEVTLNESKQFMPIHSVMAQCATTVFIGGTE
jgi:hypothetical protein